MDMSLNTAKREVCINLHDCLRTRGSDYRQTRELGTVLGTKSFTSPDVAVRLKNSGAAGNYQLRPV